MIPFTPQADPRAIVQADNVRFIVFTSRLIRLEYSANGRFEDRPTQIVWYRQQPVPPFTIKRDDQTLQIITDDLHLRYDLTAGQFTSDSLTITLLENGVVWHYGADNPTNLLGTYRTLDDVSGNTPLEHGLIARDGWAVVDDSHSLAFDEQGWLTPRQPGTDLYFFGYGQDYAACLRDYTALTGSAPLLPRWALGNWWSRYWAYTQEELTQLMRDFRAKEVPLSVCIIDMDWHLTDVDYGDVEWSWHTSGWTGYTWNRTLIPDSSAFLQWLHEQGLKTALNLHPADGVWPHEAQYAAMARRTGIDPQTQTPIPFDIANPQFAQAYFEELHHPQEADGVDFWWMDWQQGTYSGIEGLDPLWWLNHLHFYNLMRDGVKRPFIFSRWGGLGNHRYPIGFSGDTHVDWDSLAFQPYFTATAANVNYGWWSHDIGGHMFGQEDGELYTRWVQFGVFSPIFRLHSTKNRFQERCPWGYDDTVFRITRDAMQLRHALIPYLYTLSWINATESVPPVRPMYHDYPHHDEAYVCPQQYAFGPDLIVAPFTSPADPDTGLSRQVIWLPPGDWYNFFTGEHVPGDRWQALYGKLDEIPVFAKAGAIVPLGPQVGWGGVENPAELHVHLFAGADGEFTLYEDDGETLAYQQGDFCLTTMRQQWQANQIAVEIDGGEDNGRCLPATRQYHLHCHGVAQQVEVEAWVNGRSHGVSTSYDEDTETLILTIVDVASEGTLKVVITAVGNTLQVHRDRLEETGIKMLWAFHLEPMTKAGIAERWADLCDDPTVLADFAIALTDSQKRALLEVTQQAGIHHITNMRHKDLLILWNNNDNPAFHYKLAKQRNSWNLRERFGSEQGVLPRSAALIPKHEWRATAVYAGLTTVTFENNR